MSNLDLLTRAFTSIILQLNSGNDENKRFKISAYRRALESIKEMRIVDIRTIQSSYLTPHMKSVAISFLDGTRKIPEPSLLEQLSNIPGIGPTKAAELIALGVKKPQDLSLHIDTLSAETTAYIKMPPLRAIPHEYIVEKIQPLVKQANGVIVGSFRRNKPTSRDIDVQFIGAKNFNNFKSILKNACSKAIVYMNGDEKFSAIIKIGRDAPVKLDAFLSNREEAAAMLLYSTGSKEFNQRMRGRAKSLGYLLNQRGLFRGKTRIDLPNERAYFKKLDMKYLSPEERV